jgi:cytochrome c biogenesis protein CcmG, thiol:disulfide interchange protein DsbE
MTTSPDAQGRPIGASIALDGSSEPLRPALGAVAFPEHSPEVPHRIEIGRRRFVYLLPLGAFAAVAAGFAVSLGRNASEIPSALIGKPAPAFTLPPVQGRTLGLSTADLKGEVSLVNVFASWCVACREEHPIFMALKRSGDVPIHGLNYKDRPSDAANWLDTMGDPYMRTGADIDGRVGIDWGVYGVPETFVVDRNGVIAHKHIGAVTEQALQEIILPLVARLRG